MENITNIISLNIYEPELNLNYYKKPKKKSIITKIIKNSEIGHAKSQINKKYNDINKNSINLNEYNIFRKPGDKTFRPKRKNKEVCFGEDDINKTDKKNYYRIINNQNNLFDRKQLEKLNKNIPNNLYDYLHPYEYMNFSKKNDKKLTKIKPNKDLTKEIELKNIKSDNEIESNKDIEFPKYESGYLSGYFNNSKNETNKRLELSAKIIKNNNNKNKNYFINKKIIKDIIKNNNIKNTNSIKRMKINKKAYKFCEEKSSSSSSLENINNNYITSQPNFQKILDKKSIDSSNLNYHNTFSSRNIKIKKTKKDKYVIKRSIKTARFNQKVFNRNNNVLVPFEEMKKKVFNSDSERLYQQLKKSKNFFKLTENITTKNFTKDKKKFLINEISQLNTDLNEIKFYILSDKNTKGKYIDKLDDIEKKMKHGEDKELLLKDILFDKLNNSDNENDYINNYVNKNQYVNKLISSYINYNEKKKGGLLDKKFIGGLKKLNEFDNQDAYIRDIIGTKNYRIKYKINQIEEEEICKDRKNLKENTKKIKQMIKMLYRRKQNLGEGNKK